MLSSFSDVTVEHILLALAVTIICIAVGTVIVMFSQSSPKADKEDIFKRSDVVDTGVDTTKKTDMNDVDEIRKVLAQAGQGQNQPNQPRSNQPNMQNLQQQSPMNPAIPIEHVSGSTDLYDWTQNDSEVDMYVKIPQNIKKKDITLDLKTGTMSLKVSGVKLVDGLQFCKEIVPSECNWQFEEREVVETSESRVKGGIVEDALASTSGGGKMVTEKRLWITFLKKIPTKRSDQWNCVFKGHGEVELPGVGVPATGASGGPPVHSVDVNDKQSMRDALNAVRNAK